MKFTRYIVLEHNPDGETNTFINGRFPPAFQFEKLQLPDKLGKLFDRKSVALKKAQNLNVKEIQNYPAGCRSYYSVAQVKIEIEQEIERK